MVKLVGKIMPGIIAAFLGFYVLYVYVNILNMSEVLIAGFMCMWGISTAYYPVLDAIEEFKDYLHNIAAEKLGVDP